MSVFVNTASTTSTAGEEGGFLPEISKTKSEKDVGRAQSRVKSRPLSKI